MKKYSSFLLLIFCLFFSCETEKIALSGQVFVVTKGAQNIPLGLVSIGFTDSERFGSALDSALEVFDQEILDVENSISRVKNEIEGEYVLKNSLWNDVLNEAKSKTLNSFAVAGQPYALLDAKPKYNFFKNWIGSSESKRDLDLKMEGVEYFRKRLKLNSLNDYYSQVLKFDSLKKELEEIENSLEELKNDNSVITDLSEEFMETKTNAQGEFLIETEIGDHVIFASSSRLVGSETEKYMWCMIISPKEGIKDLYLSNDNLISLEDLRNISKKLNESKN